MGYYSSLYTRGDSTIIAREPELSADQILERELFAAEAKARGFEIKDTRASNLYRLVNDFLKARKDHIGWWFHVKETDDPNVIQLCEVGESGKAYELEEELEEFLAFLRANDFDLNVRIFREGEESGDVTRYTIEDSKITSIDDAEIRFPDGKGIE